MFAGVLVAVYLAVETARWVRLPPAPVLYGLAFLTGRKHLSARQPAG